MKTLLASAALVAAFAPAAVSAQAPQRVQESPHSKQPLTADQRLAKLSPAQRAEFEARAKVLGLDPRALAAQDLGTARRTLEARKFSSAGTIAGSMGTASSARGAAQPTRDRPARAEAQAASPEEAMRQRQEAMDQLAALLKRMHDTQQQVIGNMR